jgi:FMN phosphatase YigB (HAD superfamily)
MNVRAIIFDVYGTLLRVGPPPADADARWEKLFADFFQSKPGLSRLEFSIACSKAITREHNLARLRGVAYPEVLWPRIVSTALPPFDSLSAEQQADFVFQQMQLGRTVTLFDKAADVLSVLQENGLLLGIASNAQAYTLIELTQALSRFDVSFDIFERDLSLWSFQNGFSKPDCHVFQMLAARLEARGIGSAETLMVGDRLDNDIEPARAFGWQTWQLASAKRNEQSGTWRDLLAWLKQSAL